MIKVYQEYSDKTDYILDKLLSNEITREEAKEKLISIGARGAVTKSEAMMKNKL